MRKPLHILGHRGCREPAFPENSLPAFREALAHADGLETDAVLSRDGVVFLTHDFRFEDGRRSDEMSAAEIGILRLTDDSPIPKLDDLLEMGKAHPEAIFNLELKADHTALPVLDCVRRAQAAGFIRTEQVVISSFNHPALLEIRNAAPELKIGALFGLETDAPDVLYPGSENTASRLVPFRREALDDPLLRRIGPEYFNLALPSLSVTAVAAIAAAYPAARIMAWTLHEPNEHEAPFVLTQLQHLADDGLLHAWITDRPRLRKQHSTFL